MKSNSRLLSAARVLVVCSAFFAINPSVGQESQSDTKAPDSRLAQMVRLSSTMIAILEVEFGGQWALAALLKQCGHPEIAEVVQEDFLFPAIDALVSALEYTEGKEGFEGFEILPDERFALIAAGRASVVAFRLGFERGHALGVLGRLDEIKEHECNAALKSAAERLAERERERNSE